MSPAIFSKSIPVNCASPLSLLLVLALPLLGGDRASAQASITSSAKFWLDQAVSDKHCPSTPLNVISDSETAGALLDRPGFVRVEWNGNRLGRFGPVSGIVLRGAGGDDVLIAKSDVTLPAVIAMGEPATIAFRADQAPTSYLAATAMTF